MHEGSFGLPQRAYISAVLGTYNSIYAYDHSQIMITDTV